MQACVNFIVHFAIEEHMTHSWQYVQVKATLSDGYLVGYARVWQACRKSFSGRSCGWVTGHVKDALAVAGAVRAVVRVGSRERRCPAFVLRLCVVPWTVRREYGFQNKPPRQNLWVVG